MTAREKAAPNLAELAARVEGGETIVLTRDGEPVLDLAPHRRRRGLAIEAGEAFLRAQGITRSPGFIADDFDDPLPEDFLNQPSSRPSAGSPLRGENLEDVSVFDDP